MVDVAARRRHDSRAGGPRYVAKASSPVGSDGVSPRNLEKGQQQ